MSGIFVGLVYLLCAVFLLCHESHFQSFFDNFCSMNDDCIEHIADLLLVPFLLHIFS